MFYGCNRLVGGTGFVTPSGGGTATYCKLGSTGLLTDPDDDGRNWCWGTLYDDGVLEVSASSSVDESRTVESHGRVCINGSYNALGGMPWNDVRKQVLSAEFLADMAAFSYCDLNYWFYSCMNMTGVTGWSYLAGVHEMKYTFSSCTSLVTLCLTGLDPSSFTNLQYAFSGCSALVTIYVDSTWALPSSGVSGIGTFYNDKAIVGGNGTTYSSSNYGYAYCRIDTASTPGYLTAI